MAALEHRAHIRGSVEAWVAIDKARSMLQKLWSNGYVDQDVLVSVCEDLQIEQDRLIRLRPSEGD